MAIKMEMAHQLHEGLGQHLLGTLLAAQALADALNADASPRSRQASLVVNLLKGADTQLRSLILEMDGKLPR